MAAPGGEALKPLPSASQASQSPEPQSEHKFNQDEAILAYFGKRQQLKVRFPPAPRLPS